ncbi:MAG: stage 0 sporulation family protein [Gemmatimonadaceae bacterium]
MTAAAVATHLVEVEFKGNRRAFYTFTGDAPPSARTAVIVQVERGEDFARVHSVGELAEKRKAGTTHGKASPDRLPEIVRVATKREIDTAVHLRADESAVRKAAIEIVRQLKLDMKISDAEWQWDRRRLTCYFTAEERVDFRQLVRQLEKRFSTRVHMWHIGVRDEARRLDGVGRCGRQFCSSSWLPELRPVKSSAAKDQRLSTLNPAQISGTCGRLMCCLRYEHEFYVQSRKRFPKEGKIITTAFGEEKVAHNDIFRDQVTLRDAAGETRTIPLAQLRRELGDTSLPIEDEPAHDEDVPEEKALVTLTRSVPREQQPREQQPRQQPPRDPKPARPERQARDEPRKDQRPDRRDLRSIAPVVTDRPASPSVAEIPSPAPLLGRADEDDDGSDELDDAADGDTGAMTPLADAGAPGSGQSSDQGDGRRRGRRRRGRRGGRRGRGGPGGSEGAPPAGGAPDAGPSAPPSAPAD